MHLTDSAVRRQLFLDVLDGTKALVSMSGIFHVPPQKKVLRSNSILTSGQVIGFHWPGTPEAAVGRQRSAAAVPAPGLSLCPTPVSSLLGKRYGAERCPVDRAGILRCVSSQEACLLTGLLSSLSS